MLSALKNFFVTFLVAAIVFGSAAYFAAQFLTTTITGIFDAESSELDSILNPPSNPVETPAATENTHTGTDEPPEDAIQGTSFNMLFIVTDYQPDIFNDYLPSNDSLSEMEENKENTVGILSTKYRRPRAFVTLLVRADKERNEFTFTVFPAPMRVLTSSGYQNMADLYNLYGRDFIISEVAALTGLNIDYYMLLNITELSEIVSGLGGISMYLSKDLYYNGKIATNVKPNGEEADLLPLLYSIGKNTIDGPGAVALLMNENYSSGVAERSATIITMFTEIMNKLTAMTKTEFTAFYDKICENAWVDTTFTTNNLTESLDLIYAWNQEDFTKKTLDYPGRFVSPTETDAAYYEPNKTEGVALFKNYRRIFDTGLSN